MESKKQISKTAQDKIVKTTATGGIQNVGFVGGKGAAILRSDGKYHTESLEELEGMGIYPYGDSRSTFPENKGYEEYIGRGKRSSNFPEDKRRK